MCYNKYMKITDDIFVSNELLEDVDVSAGLNYIDGVFNNKTVEVDKLTRLKYQLEDCMSDIDYLEVRKGDIEEQIRIEKLNRV